jgi:outer membrane receptor for ferrienterochelin and colicins
MNIQVEYNFGKKIMLKSGLAYTRLFNFWSTDFETDKFTGLYEMQNELSYLIPKINARLVLTHRFIGKQVRFYQNDEDVLEKGFIGDYHIINASVSRNFWKKRIFVSLGIKNLLDTQSVPFVGQGDGPHSSVGNSQLLNWGRTYFIRLNLKF